MKKKSLLAAILCSVLAVSLSSCKKEKEIIVGAMAVPGAEILNAIKADFESKGYKLTVQTFSSFDLVNPPLANGSIDANLFQHEPYMNTYNESIVGSKEYEQLVVARKLYLPVYAVYSKKFNSVESLPSDGTHKAYIASDSSNQSRCLYILDSAGIITLSPEKVASNAIVSVSDVTDNKGLQLVTMDASLIANALNDSDCALGVVNASYAIPANLASTATQLAQEVLPSKLTNANILSVKAKDKDEQWVKDLVDSLTSDSAREYITTTYGSIMDIVWDLEE